MSLGPMWEGKSDQKLQPAKIVFEQSHSGRKWRVYKINKHTYDVYREGPNDKVFVKTYMIRWFAIRRYKVGNIR